jgi:hypothetical protein
MIGAQERIAIKTALERAFANPSSTEMVLIPAYHRAEVSFEQHQSGLFVHLVITIDRPNEIPSPHAIRVIANEFNIAFPVSGTVWSEPDRQAVNILVLADNMM